MRHLKTGGKFHRRKGQRQAFFKILINNLILQEKIRTTEARAKNIKPRIEKLMSIAKRQNLVGLRLLIKRLPKKTAQKLYYEIAPRYQNRQGGYIRIIKSAKQREKDGARMAIIEFV